MKIDFLILYEHKERELENACLIKYLLEKKGYIVRIKSIYSFTQHLYRPVVIIVPHLYDDYQVYCLIAKYWSRTCRVINMQYEQVISQKNMDSKYSYPKGEAQKAIVFCWGNSEANRYIHDARQRSITLGNLSMDFNHKKFEQYFLLKKEICDKYQISTNKKILLFISTFSLANVTNNYILLHYPTLYDDMIGFRDISKKSRLEILQWLECYSKKHKDIMIVYRPHPAEAEDTVLYQLASTNENFKIIRDYSIRQWIHISDFLVTWFSTSILDAYYANKQCIIVRPHDIPEDVDVPFFVSAQKVKNYEAFEQSMDNVEERFPVNVEEMHEFVSNEKGVLVESMFVNECINVYNDNSLRYQFKVPQRYKKSLIGNIKMFLKDVLYDVGEHVDLKNFYSFIYRKRPDKKRTAVGIQNELLNWKSLMCEYMERLIKVDV